MHQDNFITLPAPSQPTRMRKLAYRSWGDADNIRVVVCVHGLSRNGRDFDRLAEALAQRYRVICPDMAGRGESEWLENKAEYNYLTYCSDVLLLIAQLGVANVDWIGTSMGGIIGMMIAAQQPLLIRRMVLNDIGSVVSAEGLKRILSFVGAKTVYDNRTEAMGALKFYLAPFGITSDAEWELMFSNSFVPLPDGRFAFNYDPDITKSFREAATATGGVIADVDLSAFWALVQCPVLLLRGAESDILSKQTAVLMQKRLAPTKLVEFPGVGHAPALISGEQIRVITEWLA